MSLRIALSLRVSSKRL